MEKEKFYQVINEFVLPLFTGSFIVGEEPSTQRDSEVAYGKQNALLIKPSKNDEYRVIVKRGRAFQIFEVNLLKYALKQLNDISEMKIEDCSYEKVLQYKAIEKAICQSLSSSATETMLGIITELEMWANRTYEGKKLTFGIILNQTDLDDDKKKIHYSEVMKKDFIALLSDGRFSFLEFDRSGYLSSYISLNKVRTYVTATPNRYEYIARYCNEKRIGIALTESGDLLVFRNRALVFAKRKGMWNVYCHEEVIQLLSYKTNHSLKDTRRAIYFTALDCSFAYTGGLLIYLDKDNIRNALATINTRDLLQESYFEIKKEVELDESNKLYNISNADEMRKMYLCSYDEFLKTNNCIKTNCLREIICGKKFHELSRKMRQELVSIDGATVIDFDGTIVAVGAILKIEAGSNEGGRLAAATNLAKYGVTIKISQDGQMQGFCPDKKNKRGIRQLFTVK